MIAALLARRLLFWPAACSFALPPGIPLALFVGGLAGPGIAGRRGPPPCRGAEKKQAGNDDFATPTPLKTLFSSRPGLLGMAFALWLREFGVSRRGIAVAYLLGFYLSCQNRRECVNKYEINPLTPPDGVL